MLVPVTRVLCVSISLTVFLTVSLTIAVIWATTPSAIATFVFAIPSIIFARRMLAAAWRSGTATTRRSVPTVAIATRLESP
jgi:hypothetical protein